MDWTKITGFEWDSGNISKNFVKHGVTCRETEEIFMGNPLILEDTTHSSQEPRFRALGESVSGRILHASFTIRGDKIRPISVRQANKKERAIYESR
jgi:uncharacterized protein